MLYDKAHELAKAIRYSPEYRQYKEAKERVGQNSDSMKILQDFHAKQLEIQTMQMLGKEIPAEKMKEYERMAELLNFHPSVRDFLQAEYRIIQIMTDIQKIIAEALDFQLPQADNTANG